MTPTETQAAPTEAQRLAAEACDLLNEAMSAAEFSAHPLNHSSHKQADAARTELVTIIHRIAALATPSPVPPAEEPAAVQQVGSASAREVLAEFDRTLKEIWGKVDQPYAFAYGRVRARWEAALASSAPGTVVGEDTERPDNYDDHHGCWSRAARAQASTGEQL